MDAAIFANEFSEMFGKFSEQLERQHEALLQKIDDLGMGIAGVMGPSPTEAGKDVKNPLEGVAPNAKPPAPRQVKKTALPVIIEDISKKASKKIGTDVNVEGSPGEQLPKGKNGLLFLLGGLLGTAGAGVLSSVLGLGGSGGAVAGGVIGKAIGAIFKPLKPIAKRLPLIGSLISFYEAYENFKKGGVDNTILGIMDIAAGISYALPGIGTAIGIGIDVLSYFLENEMAEFKEENPDASFIGSIYDKVIDYLSETKQVKWLVKMGDLFGKIWKEPGKLENWVNFLTHVGKIGTGLIDMFNSFDKTVGTALGITDEKGEGMGLVAKMVDLVKTHITDPLLEMITSVFDYVGDAISEAANIVGNTARDIFSTITFGLVDDAETAAKLAEKEKQNAEMDRQLMYEGILNKKYKDLSDEEKEMRREIESDPTSDRFKQYEKDLKAAREGPTTYRPSMGGPMQDFAVINGEIVDLPSSAIVNKGKVQAFSGEDTVIGFKEGQALLEGINQLITVGQEQLKTLSQYLEKSGNNIIAPSSTTNMNNTFEIESGVSVFRKAVS